MVLKSVHGGYFTKDSKSLQNELNNLAPSAKLPAPLEHRLLSAVQEIHLYTLSCKLSLIFLQGLLDKEKYLSMIKVYVAHYHGRHLARRVINLSQPFIRCLCLSCSPNSLVWECSLLERKWVSLWTAVLLVTPNLLWWPDEFGVTLGLKPVVPAPSNHLHLFTKLLTLQHSIRVENSVLCPVYALQYYLN